MSRLFELTGAYAELAARVADGDELSSSQLALISDAIEYKAAAVVHILRDLDLDLEALDTELQRLAARKKTATNNRARLRAYVLECMQNAGVERLKAGTFSMSIADCPEAVHVDDVDQVPAEFKRTKTEVVVNKSAVLAHYRETGEIVPGVRIERGRRLNVR